ADGPASFNAELTARGGSIVSCDPIYEFTADEIR
ncbi:MAG: SAM-dependent methyltransferase, partial [Planctomycetaceae bacterium]|nr:SAM-dependent methyltransferase [Planctomycetaceae bacterium]